jgi:hypothetical protein
MLRILVVLFLASLTAVPAARATPALEWSDRYDGGAAHIDLGTTVLAAPNGDVIVGGESADGVDGIDQIIRRLDRASGEVLWEVRVRAFDGNDMALTALAWDPSGNILVGGYIRGCVG